MVDDTRAAVVRLPHLLLPGLVWAQSEQLYDSRRELWVNGHGVICCICLLLSECSLSQFTYSKNMLSNIQKASKKLQKTHYYLNIGSKNLHWITW